MSEVFSASQDISDSRLMRQTQGLPEVINFGGKKGKNTAILFTCYKYPHSQLNIHLQLEMSGVFVTVGEVKFPENYLQ